MTGSFDDWAKTVKLDKKTDRDGFEKEVQLPSTTDKVHYKVHPSAALLYSPVSASRIGRRNMEHPVRRA